MTLRISVMPERRPITISDPEKSKIEIAIAKIKIGSLKSVKGVDNTANRMIANPKIGNICSKNDCSLNAV
ncbi:MAG TPA: hypothetical protein VK094_07385 [Pseudogracilibacillus sp.]|nr:hypothetical protein [Pseudogracilibacillus sp.]